MSRNFAFAISSACAAAALLAAQPLAAEKMPDSVQPVDEAAMLRDRTERLTVPVTIRGNGPFRFLIDTGAQATVVTHEVVEKLSLPFGEKAVLLAMGGSQVVSTIELDDLEFANRSVSGLVAPLLDAAHVGADGILGLDSLQDTRVLLDFRQRRMLVTDARSDGGSRGYEIVVRARKKLGQMIITDAKVDGVTTAVIIDTGAQASVANSALLRKLRNRQPGSFVNTDVLGLETTSATRVVNALTMGEMTLSKVTIGEHDSPVFKALGLEDQPTLILGVANLMTFDRVAIDFAAGKILFDVPRDAQDGFGFGARKMW